MGRRKFITEKYPAIYIRVSTDAQFEEGYSVDAQKEQLAAYCVSKGLRNYQFYIDGGWSGSSLDRPEIQRLIKDAKKKKVSHCIVYKLDRLSRSQKDTLYLIEDVFNPNGVDFVSLNESMDTSTPMGRLMLGILSAFAQLERENIKLRTQMGMLERVKSGLWMGGGRVPFGYDYDDHQGILVPNADAEKVKQMYTMYLNGMSPQSIANILGVKYDRLVTQILKRKTNYGVIEYNGVEYLGKHQPIISKDIYDETMACMKSRSAKPASYTEHLLTGLVYCGKCGAKMRYQKWGKGCKLVCYSQQPSTKEYLVKDPNCDQPKVDAVHIDEKIEHAIFNMNDDELKKEQTSADDEPNYDALDILIKKSDDYKKQIKKLYARYASEDNDDMLLEIINDLKKELSDNEKQIEAEQNQRLANQQKLANKNKLDGLQEIWEHMTMKQRQNAVKLIINKVVITDHDVSIEFVP